MDAKFVERLIRLQNRSADDLTQKARASLEVYTNPALGWRIASTYARKRVPFPITVTGRNRWLFTAYMALLNPALHGDRHVENTHQIQRNPRTSAKLKALLIAGLGQPVDAHFNLVAEKTGFPRRTVEVFEILFFNVLDRHQDNLYLSHIVYPHGRVVELAEDYFETTPVEDLLLRVAYNHRDIDMVLRLAGMSADAMKKELHDMATAELESRIMGNALLMSKLGLVNQRGAGLERATALLSASRQKTDHSSEEVTQGTYDLAGELAVAIAAQTPTAEAERQALQSTVRPGKCYWHDEEGNVMPLDADDLVSDVSQHAGNISAPVVKFPEPVSGIWRNKDFDQPVVIVARMSEPGLPDHFLTIDGSGIPASEVFFD